MSQEPTLHVCDLDCPWPCQDTARGPLTYHPDVAPATAEHATPRTVEDAARAAAARVFGWQRLMRSSGMSPQWMDRTLGAIVRNVLAAQAAQAPTVEQISKATEHVLGGWTIGSGYDETSAGPEVAAMARAVAERVASLYGAGQQGR